MRFIIAIVLGTLMFQGSPLPLPRTRGNDVRTHLNYESTTLENAFNHTREKRSGGSKHYTNVRKVLLSHRYQYFMQVSKDGRVNGTKTADLNNGNIVFQLETYGTSLVRLYNIAHRRYIAINKNGVVITEKHKSTNSLFHEKTNRITGYVRYSLAKKKMDTWLLTLKTNGKVKNARRTNPTMNATKFFLLPAAVRKN